MNKWLALFALFVPVISLMFTPSADGIKVTGAPVDIMQDDITLGDRPFVTVTDTYSNFDPGRIDTIQVVAKGHLTKAVACQTIGTFTLTETGPNTREFSAYLSALTSSDMWCIRGDQPNQWLQVSYKIGSTYNSDYAYLYQSSQPEPPKPPPPKPKLIEPTRPVSCPSGYELRADGLCYELGCPSGYDLRPDGLCYEENDRIECLIATATYGTELAPQVQMLREIRDISLMNTASGTTFMGGFNAIYYTFAPTVAEWENQNPVFKEAVKITITPLIHSLSLLSYVEMDSEATVLGYGISMILLNIGMYFVAPAIIITKIRSKFS